MAAASPKTARTPTAKAAPKAAPPAAATTTLAKGDVGDEATQTADQNALTRSQRAVKGDGAKGGARNGAASAEGTVRVEVTFKTYAPGAYRHEDLGLSADDLHAMYRGMLLQRRFEERAAQMYGKQKIAGFLHLYIGQEAVSTGTAAAIRVGEDSVITAYRDHGIGLALGMTADEGMAEMFGKRGGSSKGKGGSMHFFKAEKGLYGGHGIVGAHVPVGVGLAFAHKYKGDGGVSVTFLGDGAVGQGAVHEALNLASLYGLPAIVVIENNGYAMGTAIHRGFGQPEFTRLAVGYGMEAAIVDGMDVLTMTKAMQDAVAYARQNKPILLEVRTYRYRGHSMSDPQNYRTKEEMDAKKGEDPIIRLKAYLVERGLATAEALDAVDEAVKAEVLAAVAFAEASPEPEIKEAYDDVYVQENYPFLA